MMMLPQHPPTTHDPLHQVAVVALVYLTAGQVPDLRLLDNSNVSPSIGQECRKQRLRRDMRL
jgi:hypothetical protein